MRADLARVPKAVWFVAAASLVVVTFSIGAASGDSDDSEPSTEKVAESLEPTDHGVPAVAAAQRGAVVEAKNLLDERPRTRVALIRELMRDGFTYEEAAYGAKKALL